SRIPQPNEFRHVEFGWRLAQPATCLGPPFFGGNTSGRHLLDQFRPKRNVGIRTLWQPEHLFHFCDVPGFPNANDSVQIDKQCLNQTKQTPFLRASDTNALPTARQIVRASTRTNCYRVSARTVLNAATRFAIKMSRSEDRRVGQEPNLVHW